MHLSKGRQLRKALVTMIKPLGATFFTAWLVLNAGVQTTITPWIGKCVGITDGDTIKVMRQGEAVDIRVWGIDAPEKGEAYSERAKQFLSELAFEKNVDVLPVERDRYERIVAKILIDGRDAGLALVREGLAWHWPEYSNNDVGLRGAEELVRSESKNIWSLPNPLPRWERRALQEGARESAAPGTITYRGNVKSKIFHAPWCRYYTCKNCTQLFGSPEEAVKAGYRAGKICLK